MIIKSTKFKDLKVIYSPIYKDRRGFFREIFKKKDLINIDLFLLVFRPQKKMF